MAEIIQAAPAAPLSAEEHQANVEQAFKLEQQVKLGLEDGRHALWRTAEALYKFDEVRGWTYLGGYDTLGDWLADPDIGITRSTYYRMVEVWREVVVTRQIDPGVVEDVDLSKMALALPAVKDGREDIDDAIDAARTNGWRDMRERYRIVDEPREVPEEEALEPSDTDIDFDPHPDVPVIEDDEQALDELHGERHIPRGIGQTLFLTLHDVRNALTPERKAISRALSEQIDMALELGAGAGLGDE